MEQFAALPEILGHILHTADAVGIDPCIADLLFEVETKMHSVVEALERERSGLQDRFDGAFATLAALDDDIGEQCDREAYNNCNLREACKRVEEGIAEGQSRRRQLEQQLTLRLAEWRQKADLEGVCLEADLVSFLEDPSGCGVKVCVVLAKVDTLEVTWPEHIKRASEQRQEIKEKCEALCKQLHEQYCEPVAANNHILLQRLVALQDDLHGKRECRLQELQSCRDCFADLQMAVAVDLSDLSVVNVTKWQLMRQQAVKEHREKIVSMHADSVQLMRCSLDTLSQSLPDDYNIVEYNSADIHVLLRQVKEMKAQLPKLQERADRAKQVKQLLAERNALIVQMQVFERTASDPARLFAPSFRLLQEERFRKTALPTLKRLESRLLVEVNAFDACEREPYRFNGEPLREWLEREQQERFFSEAVFGFAPLKSGSSGVSPAAKRHRENVNNK